MRSIHTDAAPKAIGPYSQAMHVGQLVFCSGQISIDPTTNAVALYDGHVGRQTEQVLKNLSAVIKAAGGTLGNVVKTTVYLIDMADFAAMNEVYGEFFQEHKPARACVAVSQLPRDVRVEIDAIAYI